MELGFNQVARSLKRTHDLRLLPTELMLRLLRENRLRAVAISPSDLVPRVELSPRFWDQRLVDDFEQVSKTTGSPKKKGRFAARVSDFLGDYLRQVATLPNRSPDALQSDIQKVFSQAEQKFEVMILSQSFSEYVTAEGLVVPDETAREPDDDETLPQGKELRTIYSLIATMAIKHYGYKLPLPEEERRSFLRILLRDLEEQRMKLADRTVKDFFDRLEAWHDEYVLVK